MKKIIFLAIAIFAFSCTKVPITGRRQLKLLPASTINTMSLTNYRQFLATNSLSKNESQTQMVKRIGLNIADATVFGHLKDFDVSDNLTLNVRPNFDIATKSPTLNFAFKFNE